ncbi:helix-turn-helix transcriptional regulator [Actinoplanes sp. NPDC051861]|uniref:helix-turn-helix transcriptional regulator n=1 Tax=Actinoplanes sp. NPDC051861 TaxID=3155170 RepID=UPI003445587F
MSEMPRLTPQLVAVLLVLLESPATPRWGRDIARVIGLKTGTLHPILARLEQSGLVESCWEAPDAVDRGRPRRRYYRFVPGGVQVARRAVAEAAGSSRRFGSALLRPRLAFC